MLFYLSPGKGPFASVRSFLLLRRIAATLLIGAAVPLMHLALTQLNPLLVSISAGLLAGLLALLTNHHQRWRLPPLRHWPALVVFSGSMMIVLPYLLALLLQADLAAAGSLQSVPLLAAVAVTVTLTGACSGALIIRQYGIWQSINQALLISLPLTALGCGYALGHQHPPADGYRPGVILALAYNGTIAQWLVFRLLQRRHSTTTVRRSSSPLRSMTTTSCLPVSSKR